MNKVFSLTLSIAIALFLMSADSGCEGSQDISTAKLAMSKKDTAKAKAALTRAMQADTSNGEPYYLMGNIHFYDEKNYDKAAEMYQKASVKKLGKEERKKLETITSLIANELRNEGVRNYNDGLSAFKNNDTTGAREYFTKARDNFRKAMTMVSDTSAAYVDLSKILVASLSVLRENDEATMILTKLIDKNPADTISIQQLADIYLRSKKADQAIALLTSSRQKGVTSLTMTQILFEAYAVTEKYLELEKLLEEAIANSTGARRTQFIEIGKGILLQAGVNLIFEEKKYDLAIEKLQKAYSFDTSYSEINAQIIYNLSAAYTRVGDDDQKAFREKNPGKKVKKGRQTIVEEVPYDGYKVHYEKALAVLKPVAAQINKKPYWRLLAKIYGSLGNNQEAQNALNAEKTASEE
ncbi:MAG: hypothetical protein SFU91_09915 [Chloroherpetonaceae bacterium]|nr:hypothetical protein [Chloroherpetonaceae bacterium]